MSNNKCNYVVRMRYTFFFLRLSLYVKKNEQDGVTFQDSYKDLNILSNEKKFS